jgi:hypothetical protein
MEDMANGRTPSVIEARPAVESRRHPAATSLLLQGRARCERNADGEIVEIWIGGQELLGTVIECNDRYGDAGFTIAIECSPLS